MNTTQIEMTPSAVAAILRMAEAGPLPYEALATKTTELAWHLAERYGFNLPSQRFAEQTIMAMRLIAEREELQGRLQRIAVDLAAVDEGERVTTKTPNPVFEAPPLKPVRGAA